ncbi:hypothetical protein I7I48_04118 [Histoplasma ohiense]|nr:hypothetical protein I7I48_04118 [Histoplasma ohiense (nom. inval.)]
MSANVVLTALCSFDETRVDIIAGHAGGRGVGLQGGYWVSGATMRERISILTLLCPGMGCWTGCVQYSGYPQRRIQFSYKER